MKLIVNSREKIVSSDVGKEYSVYKGNEYVTILVTDKMINSYFGEYIYTKKLGSQIHQKKKKEKKKVNGTNNTSIRVTIWVRYYMESQRV